MMSASLEEQLKLLHEKLDRIISLLETRPKLNVKSQASDKAGTKKHAPVSQDDIARAQERFERLYRIWEAGEELKVVEELDAMDAAELRRFADANNLNVTSKTAKQKVMKLIEGRFRERRQLMRPHFSRRSGMD
jgi:DNA polymerase III sliding clamp (beta) subunit (PCNA family)